MALASMRATRHRPARQLLVLIALMMLPYGLLMQNSQPQRLGIDLLLPVVEFLAGDRPQPPIAVVVIDEQTYERSPFLETPQVAWTPLLAEVLRAVDKAGAKVVGLDLIYPTSLDRPELIPGYDRPFLIALRDLGRSGRLVLGYAPGANKRAIVPYRGQIVAVGAENLRPVNVLRDPDEVVRRYLAGFSDDQGNSLTSFAVELVRRFGIAPPDDTFLVDFTRNPATLPVYSLADMLACARGGNEALLRERFADRIVLIGTALDIEDRHLTTRRLSMTGSPPPAALGCPGVEGDGAHLPTGRSIPGVFIHAAAAETLLDQRIPRIAPVLVNAALVAGMAALIVLILLRQPPLRGMLTALAVCLLVYVVAVLAATRGVILPYLDAWIAIATAYVATYAYRFVLEQDARGLIVRQFGRYVSPTVVRQLEARDDVELGGETRQITVVFFDIAGFTSLSERLQHKPKELLEIANLYLGRIADLIQAHGGYVDKFIGDGIMAIWGAPDADPDAATHAVDGVLACQRLVATLNAERQAQGQEFARLQLRVGINSGPAIVGNVGSRDRVNYTALGDTVNLASRLEGVNKEFGTRTLISESTRRLLTGRHVTRRVGRIAVRGKQDRIRAYELCDMADEADESRLLRFRNALAAFYRGRFAQAAAAFRELRHVDPAAEIYLERCESLVSKPVPAGWDGSLKF
jgi:class 3 adenylate cyclase/CHASE2 domain-containing sensor protein